MYKKFLPALIPVFALCLFAFRMKDMKSNFQKDNELSAAEKKAGWVLLFDGKSTRDWRPYQNKESDGWEITGGEIYCKEKDVKHRADLITKEQFGDFELEFDWKVAKGANSGLVYRANEAHPAAYESGPEYR